MKNQYKRYLLGLFLLIPRLMVAQSSAELAATVRQLSEQIKAVPGSAASYEQQLTFDNARPYLVTISVKETDKKGQNTLNKYVFNLADLDAGAVNFEAKKELMVLTLKTKAKQSFIGLTTNDALKNNVSQLTLYGTDADNARTLADLFRKVVPVADKQFLADVRLPDSYEGLLRWIAGNVDTTPAGSESLQQSIELDKANPLLISVLQVVSLKGKATEQLWVVNVADLNAQRVNLAVEGSLIQVSLENKDRFIRAKKNGQWDRNTSEVNVLCFTAHKARTMQIAWQRLLPLANKLLEAQRARFVQYNSLSDGLQRLSDVVKPAENGADHIEQQLEAGCLTTLTQATAGRKSVNATARFHWSDMDGRAAKLKSSGAGFVVEVPAREKGCWITTTKNGLRGTFENQIEIMSNDPETVRFIPALLEKIIPDCQKAIGNSLPPGGMTWVTRQVNDLRDEKAQMTYELKPGDAACTYTYTTKQNTGKATTELKWDLKLNDLDAQAVKIDISGSELTVILSTKGKEKLIKAYKDGQPASYANQVSFPINNLEIARPMAELWRKAIAACSGK